MDNSEIIESYYEALKYLFSQLPMFSRVGGAAYKPGLDRTIELDRIFGHPHRKFRTIHIGGSNGKGSTSHLLASILQANGYKTGLYTSPHLVDFRERIRINGEMIPEQAVVDFTNNWISQKNNTDISPSFFELTMMLAFDWFAKQKVDYAIIEVGMGGRLDSTNIITPELCTITNISFDHTQFLGDTLEKIAAEKAGIIKEGIPVIIGEATPDIQKVFNDRATSVGAPLYEAYSNPEVEKIIPDINWGWDCTSSLIGEFNLPLAGIYQKKNINTVLKTVRVMMNQGIKLEESLIRKGIEDVVASTGLRGRWMKVSDSPLTICDTGHNEAGLREISSQLSELMQNRNSGDGQSTLRMVIGFVADKDIDHILPLLPKNAIYYITEASIPRAMDAYMLRNKCMNFELNVRSVSYSVKDSVEQALKDSSSNDIVYIGGSTFVVAEFLA